MSSKYKIENEDESSVEKQFLNMDLFYIKRKNSRFAGNGLTAEELRSASQGYNFHRLFAQLTGEVREGRGEDL